MNPNLRNVLDVDVRRDLERGKDDIVFFAWRFLGLKLHPGQIRFLRSADGQVNILVPGNRFGKTVIIAVRHIHFNFYKVGINDSNSDAWVKLKYRTAALAPNSKVLLLDYQTIMDIMRGRFKISKEGDPVVTNECRISWYLVEDSCKTTPNPFIQFQDNCAIQFYSTSEDKGGGTQGDKFGYGSYDEGGRSYHLETEINQNLGPRFSELNAPLDIVSTPYQDSPSLTFHHEIFQRGLRQEAGYRSFEGSAYENVYLPPWYFKREELRLKGDPIREQVIEGKFVFSGNTLYKTEDIDAALTPELNGGERYKKGSSYIFATDTSFGSIDEQVHTVLYVPDDFDIENIHEGNKLRLVRQSAHVGTSKSPAVAMQDFTDLWDAYDYDRNCRHILETFNGESGRWYMDLPDHIRYRTKCYGTWTPPHTKKALAKKTQPTTNSGKKIDIHIALRKILAANAILLPSDNKELIQQLKMYREDDKDLKTDRVISLALACWLVLDSGVTKKEAKMVAINW